MFGVPRIPGRGLDNTAATQFVVKNALWLGVLCLVLGGLTFAVHGLGFVFLAAAIILAIVAMTTRRILSGLLLLVISGVVTAALGFLFMLIVAHERARNPQWNAMPKNLPPAVDMVGKNVPMAPSASKMRELNEANSRFPSAARKATQP